MKNSLYLFLISFFSIFMHAKAATGEKDLLHLKYGQNEQNKLDLFLPENYNERTAVIFMLHGGAWMMGGNEYTDKTARDLRGRGFIVANVDYRYISNSVHANDLLNDIQSAFEFLMKKGKQYKFRQQGYHLAGISAGAHLALLYGYTSKENIKSISALCPPTMLDNPEIMSALEKNKLVKNVELLADAKYISGEAVNIRFSEVSPYYHIKQIPTLLFHGDKDDLVPDSQSKFLFKRLQQKKSPQSLFL